MLSNEIFYSYIFDEKIVLSLKRVKVSCKGSVIAVILIVAVN
jgi:hypothetical protein